MLKFSAFLSCVEVTKCVKLQVHRCKGFKVGIFQISPIAQQIKLSNDGPVSQTGESVTTSETLSNHRALNGTG